MGPISTEAVNCRVATEFECRDNEFGYLFYYDLGGLPFQDETGNQVALGGEMLFDIQPNYWSATEVQTFGATHHAWSFGFNGGGEGVGDKVDPLTAWAVHDGKVGPVPEPASILLRQRSGCRGIAPATRTAIGECESSLCDCRKLPHLPDRTDLNRSQRTSS